ncbi:hypothetical protein HDV57DRAFT_494549 [Trichoderma longibrachiatum]|uniref:Uncharacterized protein n=1 Tax=Trichoderma longibrachiatum ATCC 18648 TaxID=983965 RepID=A0A2T4C589_TRILO|nr:hypothetical protein M440DRAFT_1231988 [Trichoderma longibrachiatum ATCC 18648]
MPGTRDEQYAALGKSPQAVSRTDTEYNEGLEKTSTECDAMRATSYLRYTLKRRNTPQYPSGHTKKASCLHRETPRERQRAEQQGLTNISRNPRQPHRAGHRSSAKRPFPPNSHPNMRGGPQLAISNIITGLRPSTRFKFHLYIL